MKVTVILKLLCHCACALFFFSAAGFSAANKINIQGTFFQNDGVTPITGASHVVDVRLYTNAIPTAGETIYFGEKHTSVDLATDGKFNILLGQGNLLPEVNIPLDNVSFDKQYFMEVTLDTVTVLGRQPLGSSGYASGSQGNFITNGTLMMKGGSPVRLYRPLNDYNWQIYNDWANNLRIDNYNSAGSIYRQVLYMSDTGRIGIGTTDPQFNLAIHGSNAKVSIANTNTTSTSELHIGGQYPYEGYLSFYVPSWHAENRTRGIYTNGGNIAFNMYTCAGWENALTIWAPGGGAAGSGTRVGIGGITDPQYILDVNGNARCTSLTETSDERLKKEVEPLPVNIVSRIKNLKTVKYSVNENEMNKALKHEVQTVFSDTNTFVSQTNQTSPGKKDTPAKKADKKQLGVIAQDLEAQFPELVLTDENGYKSVAYSRISVVLLEAIKEQQSEIEALRQEITQLKNKK